MSDGPAAPSPPAEAQQVEDDSHSTRPAPRKVGVLYSSVTGNNKRLVDSFLKQLQSLPAGSYEVVEVDILEHQKRRRADPKAYSYPSCDFYLVGTWADCFQPSLFVQDYLTDMPAEALKDRPVAAFSVHGGNSGIVTAWILRTLSGKGAIPVEELNATFRSNWPTPFWPKDKKLTQSILRSEVARVDEWCKKLAAMVAGFFIEGVKPEPCKQMSNSKYSVLKTSTKMVPSSLLRSLGFKGALSADPNVCVLCRRCEAACPYDAWTCQDGRVMLWDKSKCHGCLACSRVCSTGALRDGKGKPFVQRDLRFREDFVEDKVRWRRQNGTGK